MQLTNHRVWDYAGGTEPLWDVCCVTDSVMWCALWLPIGHSCSLLTVECVYAVFDTGSRGL